MYSTGKNWCSTIRVTWRSVLKVENVRHFMYLEVCTSQDDIKIYGLLYIEKYVRFIWYCTKSEFSINIFSVNVTKSTGNCEYGHIC